MKLRLFIVRAGVFLCSMGLFSSLALAASFQDVSVDHPQRMAIDYLTSLDILKGREGTSNFDPNGTLNRAEWAVIMTREAESEDLTLEEYRDCFPDVTDQWFAPAVCYALDQEWVKGYQSGPEQGKFIPWNTLNLAEVLVILERAFFWPTKAGHSWFEGALSYAQSANIVDASVPFDHALTRAEAAEIFFRTLALEELAVDRYDPLLGQIVLREVQPQSDTPSDPSNESPSGTSQANLRAFAPADPQANVTRGATSLPALRFFVESPGGAVIDRLEIAEISVGALRDLINSRLIVNGDVIREQGIISGNADVMSWGSLNLRLDAQSPALVELIVDLSPQVPQEVAFQFQVRPNGIQLQGGGTVTGNEVSGQTFRTMSIPTQLIRISNPESPLKAPFVGSTGEIIARFDVTTQDHPIGIRRVKLQDGGDLNPREYTNFRLSAGSTEIAFIERIEGNVLDFSVNNHVIEENQTRGFKVTADISSDAVTTDDIRLFLDRDQEFYAVDLQFGFGVRVDNQFSTQLAWCAGAESPICPDEGLRKRCGKEEREQGLRGCEVEEEEEDDTITSCDDRIAPVCASVAGTGLQTYVNRCFAEFAGATSVAVGPCDNLPSYCSSSFSPVCTQINGSSVSFPNACYADRAGQSDYQEGACF